MPNSFWWIPLNAGFQDGVNPCILMTAAITFLGFNWFKDAGFKIYWVYLFLGVMLTCSFLLNCGYFDKIFFNKIFFETARWIYVVLGLGVGWQGINFFLQWFFLRKENKVPLEKPIKKNISSVILGFLIVGAACFLSVLGSLWPVNYYISMFSMYMQAPDQFLSMGIFIFLYTLVSFWLVYLVVWFVHFNKKNLGLFKIIGAAVLLSASIGVVDLFL